MKQTANALLIVSFVSVAAFLLGFLYMQHLKTQMHIEFSRLTQTTGAWSKDRAFVAEKLGIDVNTLPSMKK